jgi:hypothetical protein
MFKKKYGLSRQSISLGIPLCIQAELKGTSTMLVVTVTEGHLIEEIGSQNIFVHVFSEVL